MGSFSTAVDILDEKVNFSIVSLIGEAQKLFKVIYSCNKVAKPQESALKKNSMVIYLSLYIIPPPTQVPVILSNLLASENFKKLTPEPILTRRNG